MKKTLTGKIISKRMEKTVIVQVERKFKHSQYLKTIVRHKKFKAHCENPDFKLGDYVVIQETRPISKDKHFIVIKKLEVKSQNSKVKVKS